MTFFGIDYPRYLADVSVMLIRAVKFDCKMNNQQISTQIPPGYGDRLFDYVSNLFRETRISYSIVIVGLLYLLRFHQRLRGRLGVFKKDDNAFVLFVVAMLLSSKWLCDRPLANSCWAKHAQISLGIINHQELFFLNAIGHDLYVEAKFFDNWVKYLFHPNHTLNYQYNIPRIPSIQFKRKRISLPQYPNDSNIFIEQLQNQDFHNQFFTHLQQAPQMMTPISTQSYKQKSYFQHHQQFK
jgi:hypothetical protein